MDQADSAKGWHPTRGWVGISRPYGTLDVFVPLTPSLRWGLGSAALRAGATGVPMILARRYLWQSRPMCGARGKK